MSLYDALMMQDQNKQQQPQQGMGGLGGLMGDGGPLSMGLLSLLSGGKGLDKMQTKDFLSQSPLFMAYNKWFK